MVYQGAKKCSENYCKCEQKAQTEIVSNLNALQIDINIVLALFILVEYLIVLEWYILRMRCTLT